MYVYIVYLNDQYLHFGTHTCTYVYVGGSAYGELIALRNMSANDYHRSHELSGMTTIYVYLCIYTYINIYIYIYIYIYNIYIYIYIYTYIYVYMYMLGLLTSNIYLHLNMYIYSYMYVHT
jgi:hypothetical protein